MPFQPASQATPDVLGALLLIRRRISENPAMTPRMYEAICQVLEYIYLLPIVESEADGPPDFILLNEGIYERMDNRLRRVESWVCQWPHREGIDTAFALFREVYQEFLVHVANLQGEERRNAAQDYVDELEEFGSDSEPETIGIDDSDDDDSVVTPPYQERQPSSNSQPERRNRD